MLITRASASSYITENFLKIEARQIQDLGVKYSNLAEEKPSINELLDADVLIINSQQRITSDYLKKWENGRLILTTSSGYDHIDCESCAELGIKVARTPEARTGRVAEHTLALAGALLRDLGETGIALREGGEWRRREAAERCRELSSEKVGIIGYGLIGQLVCQRLTPLVNSPPLVCDPAKKQDIKSNPQLRYAELEELLKKATLISIHADLNSTSHHLIDEKSLSLCKPQALLVNTARGAIVKQSALLSALEEKTIGGAGLDVFENEPPEKVELSSYENLIVTPHAAGFGPQMLDDLQEEIVETIKNFINDSPLPHPVN